MSIAKKLVKSGFRAAGLSISRAPNQVAASKNKFGPDDADEFKWIRSAGIKTVLDIGAHAGETSKQMRAILPNATIYAFEPLPGPYESMTKLMTGDANFSAFRCALGDTNGMTEIHANDFSQSSSLLPMGERHETDFPFTMRTEAQSIEVRRLDDIAPELFLRENILIKVDVQGFEDRVIAGGTWTIKRAKILIMEVTFVELYQGQPLFPAIYDRLRQLGFTFGGQLHQLRSPKDGLPLQADAIFHRES